MWRRHDAQDHHHRGRPGVAGGTSRRAVANVPERARPDTGTNSTSGNVTTFRDRSGRITGVTPGALWSQQVFPDPRWTGSKIL